FFLFFFVAFIFFALIPIPSISAKAVLIKVTRSFLVVTGMFLALHHMRLLSQIIYFRFDISHPDNLRMRKVRTQIQYLTSLCKVIIIVAGVSFFLMGFENVRNVGVSLITSAGILGAVVGIAAQRSLANIISGFLIAFTQPLRLDDVVIKDGEWGR